MSLLIRDRSQNEVVVGWSQGRLVTMLGPHVPDLRALELLVVVSRTGSLGAAAAELGITQQAASSRVRTMESLVGEPLVTRSKRGSELTPTGELVVQWADRVLDAAQELDAGIGALRADRRGHLDIAASLTIAEHLLPGWLVGLRAQQVQRGQQPTDITMTATNTQRVVELVTADEVTLGFVEGPDARGACGTASSAPTSSSWSSGPRTRGRCGPAAGSRRRRSRPRPSSYARSGRAPAPSSSAPSRTCRWRRPSSSSRVRRPCGPPSPPAPVPRRSARMPSATTWPPGVWSG